MNLILFEAQETERPLSLGDPRARHLIEVLRCKEGATFDAGIINGARGKATVGKIGAATIELQFRWQEEPPPLMPMHLLIGMPRPQTAKKVLLEATSLGVATMRFFNAAKGESSYRQSTLWSSGEWRKHLVAGAEQAFCTRLPEVREGGTLEEAIAELKEGTERKALDNYEATIGLGSWARGKDEGSIGGLVLAFGAERGWSSEERDCLRKAGFELAHLGPRVLRLETAVVAAVALTRDLLFCGENVRKA